jgi:hypothetical protein
MCLGSCTPLAFRLLCLDDIKLVTFEEAAKEMDAREYIDKQNFFLETFSLEEEVRKGESSACQKWAQENWKSPGTEAFHDAKKHSAGLDGREIRSGGNGCSARLDSYPNVPCLKYSDA